jgi:hypothetical protein
MSDLTRPIRDIVTLREAIEGPRIGYFLLPPIAINSAAAIIKAGLSWAEISTTERILLRFLWESYHHTSCPFPLHIV